MNFKIEKDWTSSELRCVAIASSMGHRCGYVGVPHNHPLYQCDYSKPTKVLTKLWSEAQKDTIGKRGIIPLVLHRTNDNPTPDVVFNVHGSLTYSGGNNYPVKETGLWWFGFDCNHCDDIPDPDIMDARYKAAMMYPRPGVIRTLNYVISECESLAKQLSSIQERGAKNAQTL